jgi:hypothetical protein
MSTTRLVRALCALLVAAGALIATFATAPAAHASCIANPSPSPYRFLGVVVRTELGQRVAYVRTGDGRDVVVRGTTATAENSFTTVDRTYLTGHTYMFHPSTAASPYQDSGCSLTADLGTAPTETTLAGPRSEAELVGDDPATSPVALWSLGALLGALLLVVGIVLVRRSRRTPTEPSALADVGPADEQPDRG